MFIIMFCVGFVNDELQSYHNRMEDMNVYAETSIKLYCE